MKLFLTIVLSALLDIVPGGQAFLNHLQKRDSILIADQLEYGFVLENVEAGAGLGLADFSVATGDTLVLVRDWQLDTLGRIKKNQQNFKIKASVIISPFEEGTYELPDIPVLIYHSEEQVDTLMFDGQIMEVKTMPVDTATFQIHDIKGQITYPITADEVAPYLVGLGLAGILIALIVWLVTSLRSRKEKKDEYKEPAHIVALRQLDKYRGDKYWKPENQKIFYSGVTDALKNYIDARFGVDAPEMTTAELFDAIKSDKEISPELYNSLKALFETADFVKFAKYIASEEDNAGVLPLAVRFVTTTYQSQIEAEGKEKEQE